MAGRPQKQDGQRGEGPHKLKLAELQKEKEAVDNQLVNLPIIADLVNSEIEKLNRNDMKKYVEIHLEKPTKISQKVLIPIKDFPKMNFVGKILGPGGQNLKTLQQETGTRMAVLGRGSTRDAKQEEQNRESGDPKYAHLKEELHVLIECVAPPVVAYERIAASLTALQPYLTPDEDQGYQQGYANGSEQPPPLLGGRGRGRGGPPPGVGRGGRGGLLGQPGRGGARYRDDGMGAGRGGPPRAPARGGGRGGAMMREDPYYAPERRNAYEEAYEDPYAREEYAREPAAPASAYRDPYEYAEQRPRAAPAGGDTQYFDYGHGSSTRDAGYGDGYDQSGWGQGQSTGGYGKAPSARAKPSEMRQQPYAARPAARAQRY